MARTSRTPKKRKRFLEALAETGNVTAACKLSAMVRTPTYYWRWEDEEFAAEWDQALHLGIEAIEDEAIRRATTGVKESVFYKGGSCGEVTKYSDTLLIFLLKGAKPEKYVERRELTGAGGGPVHVQTITRRIIDPDQ